MRKICDLITTFVRSVGRTTSAGVIRINLDHQGASAWIRHLYLKMILAVEYDNISATSLKESSSMLVVIFIQRNKRQGTD